MRRSTGISGNSRMPSTQTLIAVRCIGRRRSRWRTPGRRITGRIAATIGRKRTLDSVTASATSQSDAVVSVETRMTCAGAAQISTVDSAIHQKLKPTSCASAPMPT